VSFRNGRELPVDGVIVAVAQYFFLLSIAITGLVWLRLPAYRKWTLATAGLTGGLAGLGLIALAGSLYYDPRPFVVQHIHPLFTHAADNGFPSDHATLTMFLAVCVLFCSRPWGIVLAINALLVGTARVLAHVHSPLDIAAGYAIGAAAAVLASWLAPVIVARIPLASARPPSPAAPQPRHDQLTRPPG
jgi:undecaprenyl-diphosphatase